MIYVSYSIELKQKNVLKNKRLNCLRTNTISFICLGTSKTLSLEEFDESKTHLFLIHFSGMFLTILDLFYAKLWNIHQLYVLQVLFGKKKEKTRRK